jgi:hypothetical protein
LRKLTLLLQQKLAACNWRWQNHSQKAWYTVDFYYWRHGTTVADFNTATERNLKRFGGLSFKERWKKR